MTFDALAAGQSVFVDANVFLHYFTMHPRYAPACHKFLERIENHELTGFTSSAVLAEVVHRLMTIEACHRFRWAAKGIARRLRRHPAEVQQLARPRQAVDEITLFGIDELPVSKGLVSLAIDVSRQTGLLCGDAVLVTVMQTNGLTNLASNDKDFDRVPGIARYGPV
jgi:predicted nucleic acid-binding protein